MRIFAKILTYSFNAYVDAQICEELVAYIRSDGKTFATQGTVTQERVQRLVEGAVALGFDGDKRFLISLAYTEYYVNGLADILYLYLLWPLVWHKRQLRQLYNQSTADLRKQLTTSYHYEEMTVRPGVAFWYWLVIVTTPWRWVARFARERCYFTGTLDKERLREASLLVQRQNTEHNHHTAKILRSGVATTDPKVLELRAVAKQLKKPQLFLQYSATTEEAAARWDRLFAWIIRR